ncbi:hypothetical protein D3C84_956050 [compost metagenome]
MAGKASTAQSASRVFSHCCWAALILAVMSASCDGFLPYCDCMRSVRPWRFSLSRSSAVVLLKAEHSRVWMSFSTLSHGLSSDTCAACTPVAISAIARMIDFIIVAALVQ